MFACCSTTAPTSARGCAPSSRSTPRRSFNWKTRLPRQDKDGYTPLHIAAGYLNRGVVRLLLAAGADPELQDKQGRSALDLIVALKENTPNTAEFFTRRGALDEVAKARATLQQQLAQLPISRRGCATRRSWKSSCSRSLSRGPSWPSVAVARARTRSRWSTWCTGEMAQRTLGRCARLCRAPRCSALSSDAHKRASARAQHR